MCGWRGGVPRGRESWRKPGLRSALFLLLLKNQSSLEFSEWKYMSKIFKLSDCLGSDGKISPSLCGVCMHGWKGPERLLFSLF